VSHVAGWRIRAGANLGKFQLGICTTSCSRFVPRWRCDGQVREIELGIVMRGGGEVGRVNVQDETFERV
jgi:hypothetical protein